MEGLNFDIAIIGGGIATITFAENYRKYNPNVTIAIFEKTNEEPYSKVLLPHFVKKVIPIEKTIIRTQKQLEDKGIKYFKNENITYINIINSSFESSSYLVSFNKLILATGGEAREISTSTKPLYFQTLEDAKILVDKLETTDKTLPAIVLGGGFISFEFFEIFQKYRFKTINLLRSGKYFSHLSPQQLTPILIKILKQNSVEDIINIENIEDITNDLIRFDGKTIRASIVAVGAGLTRSHNFFGKTEEGIKTNEFLETDYKNIYAIGDVAIVTKNNTPKITGNWNNAIQQGIWLAKYLSKQIDTEYSFSKATDYTTSFFGNHLSFIGNTNQKLVTNKIVVSDSKQFIAETYIENKLVGAVLLNTANKRTFYQDEVSKVDD